MLEKLFGTKLLIHFISSKPVVSYRQLKEFDTMQGKLIDITETFSQQKTNE